MSFSMSCSCRLMVFVTMTTRSSCSTMRLMAGIEIGERLADPGPGLDHQPAAARQRGIDGGGHLDLLRARLEVFETAGDGAVGGEQILDVDGHGWGRL